MNTYDLFPSFEELLQNLIKNSRGSYYERQQGLKPRCFFGRKWSDEFGTITYVTDDGRVALLWAFQLGNRNAQGWFYIYPSDDTLMYFLNKCKKHISTVLKNNNKEYKIGGERMNEKNNINWDNFRSKFFTLEPGDTAEVKLKNWREEKKSFMDSDKERPALVFDVEAAEVGGKQENYNPFLEWSTTSAALAQEFRPIIEKAEREGRNYLLVRMKRTNDKRYMVIDTSR